MQYLREEAALPRQRQDSNGLQRLPMRAFDPFIGRHGKEITRGLRKLRLGTKIKRDRTDSFRLGLPVAPLRHRAAAVHSLHNSVSELRERFIFNENTDWSVPDI